MWRHVEIVLWIFNLPVMEWRFAEKRFRQLLAVCWHTGSWKQACSLQLSQGSQELLASRDQGIMAQW